MKGAIHMINIHRGMVAVQTENGDSLCLSCLETIQLGKEIKCSRRMTRPLDQLFSQI